EAAGPGNDAHALLHWRRYLEIATKSPAEERADLERRIAEATARTTSVKFYVFAAKGERPAALVLRREGASEDDALEIAWSPKAEPVSLDPGPWTVVVLDEHRGELLRDAFEVAANSGDLQRVTVGEESGDRAVPVTVTVGPREAIDAGARVRFVPTGTSEASVRLVQGRSSTWDVAPGAYTLEVAAPGFRDYAEAITVAPDLGAYEVELQPFRRINGVGIGLGVLSGVTLISGASILGVFAGRQYSKVLSRYFEAANANPVNHYNDAYALINRNLSIQHFGWVMIGGTVGVGISALTTIPTIAERPKRAAKIEMVTGAVITSAGLVSTLLTYRVQSRAFREDEDFVQSRQGIRLDDDRRDDLKLKQRLMNASAAAVGLGAGLLVGGVVMFIQHRRAAASPRVDVALAPGTLQLGLSGRF
ncbi:MAG: hypothetical protein KC636_35760, partial [Myxococcales bacterium]|nr:hypothetical protein [Myxococcales bacterium]